MGISTSRKGQGNERGDEMFSRKVSQCLDYLGYNENMVQYRRQVNQQMDYIHNEKNYSVINITSGGKSEGTALYFESDIDRLYVVKGVRCAEAGEKSEGEIIFEINAKYCSPGYTRLKLIKNAPSSRCWLTVVKYLVKENEDYFLSNSFSLYPKGHIILFDINGSRIDRRSKTGPSSPFGNAEIKYDFVFGLHFECKSLLQSWMNRVKKKKWPTPCLIETIAKLEAHVVPVANKSSINPTTEWRICFTRAEIVLMHSFNDVETKLYVLLKLMTKHVLAPICSELSSYMMKNIVFWMKEDQMMFTPECLLDRLIDGLLFLRQCVSSNKLDSYMIPERNLLEGRISADERHDLLDKLDELIAERELVLNRVDKIRKALCYFDTSEDMLKKESEKRDDIEKLVLQKNIRFKEIDSPGNGPEEFQNILNQDQTYSKLSDELYMMVMESASADRGKNAEQEQIFRTRLKEILS